MYYPYKSARLNLLLEMLKNILSLTKKFISIKSIQSNRKALDGVFELALSNFKEYTVERFERNNSKSALIYNQKKRPKKFKMILNVHLDVIPGKESQYIPRIKGNKLYGAGSMDMKASVACIIMAFKEVADKISYPLALQLVTDEEVGGFDGTKYQIEKGVKADFVLAGEPTNFDIVNEAKGVLKVKISTKGKTAHGAYPWRGENAVWKMNEFLKSFREKYPTPKSERWATTMNLAKIETSNQALNKIPDDCSAWFDIRYISEEESTILKDIKRFLPKSFVLDVITKEPALSTSKDNNFVLKLRETTQEVIKSKVVLRGAHGTSDARHFSRVGCSGVEFGPIGGGIGSDDEWVDIRSLEKYYQILRKFLLSLDS